MARARGVPDRRWATAGTLLDIATASADFRDEYYGLIDAVIDDPSGALPRLITSGLIDPAELLWGRRATTFNRVRREFPRVQLDLLSDALRMWAARRMVPKVLVATQTKVLEAIVDEDGSLLPSVPVITIEAPVDDLWRIAALLVSPPIAAIAATRHLGAALSADALKLSARRPVGLAAASAPRAMEQRGRNAPSVERGEVDHGARRCSRGLGQADGRGVRRAGRRAARLVAGAATAPATSAVVALAADPSCP